MTKVQGRIGLYVDALYIDIFKYTFPIETGPSVAHHGSPGVVSLIIPATC